MKFALLAVAMCTVTLLILRTVAIRMGWVDLPDSRKAHLEPVPAIGGVCWVLSFCVAAYAAGLVQVWPGLFLGLLLLAVTGAIDDQRPLPSWLRLLAQAGAVVAVFSGQAVLLQDFGRLFWPDYALNVGFLAWPITVFACVGVINALNMIDGMDGLLGSIALATLALLTALFHAGGARPQALCFGLALASLLPFLFMNMRTPWLLRAKVFFGDAGSMSLGLLLAWGLVSASQAPVQIIQPVTALYLFAVPLIDTVSLMVRRAQKGRSPFVADQEHLHHLLQRSGFSVSTSLLMIVGAVLALQVLGLALAYAAVPEFQRFAVFVVIALAYHFSVTSGIRRQRWLGRTLADELVRA